MNWSSLQSMFSAFLDRILHSKKALTFLAVFISGLGVARFSYAATFSILIKPPSAPTAQNSGSNSPSRAPQSNRINPQSLVGGNLFADVITISSMEAAEDTPTVEVKNFILLGTLEGHWSFARAVIQVIGSNEMAREYAIGQSIGIAKIIGIGREKIWVRINGEKKVVRVGEDPGKLAQNQAGGKQTVAEEGDVTLITRVLLRQEVNEKLKGNREDMYRGAKWGPLFENKKIVGFKIFRLSGNHIFYALGARSGDVIKSVNGFELSNTERMLELWNNVATMNRIQILLDRNGKKIKYDFHIRN
ncbi:MAG: hypothetical protein ABUK01_09265 [Leptospirales bacterium]